MGQQTFRVAEEGAPLPILDEEQRLYATRWDRSAEALERDGHYEWMASFVRDYPRVLEIGTGVGHSTVALLRGGHAVVGVDENPVCLSAAEQRLVDGGYPVAVVAGARRVSRLRVLDVPAGLPRDEAHLVHYGSLHGTPAPDVGTAVLIEGNVLTDPELDAWLASLPAFDAVVCWLIGTHKAVALNAQLGFRNVHGERYRLRVQNTLYPLAERLLRPGGVLHIVDRIAGEEPAHVEGHVEVQREQATLAPRMEVDASSVASRGYDYAPDSGQIALHDGTLAAVEERRIALASVLVRRSP